MLKLYQIYHSIENDTIGQPIADQPRKLVGIVKARSLAHAYWLTQHISRDWNPRMPVRSTTTGDVIKHITTKYMVDFQDFIRIN